MSRRIASVHEVESRGVVIYMQRRPMLEPVPERDLPLRTRWLLWTARHPSFAGWLIALGVAGFAYVYWELFFAG